MKDLVPCTYRNLASHPQVLRIAELPLYFERTVFPRQCIVFQAPRGSLVEIHDHITALPSDALPCEELRAINADSILQFQPLEVV